MTGSFPGAGPVEDADLGDLFEAAWAEGSYGPANERLIGFLKTKLGPLRGSFRVDIDECVGRAWRLLAEKHTNTGFDDVPNVLAWVRAALKGALVNALKAESHLVGEDTVKSGELSKARALLGLADDESILDRSVEFTDWGTAARSGTVVRVSPAPGSLGPHEVWRELGGLLLKLGWSGELASECVRASEEYLQKVRTERGSKASAGELSRQLPKDVPKGLRIALARFVIDPRGYVVAVLEGTPPAEAELVSQVRKTLPGLAWTSN